MRKSIGRSLATAIVAIIITVTLAKAEDGAQVIPRHDGKPADITRPVQVFVLLGQSNMVGLGNVKGDEISLEHAVKEK